ncbi:hypothetical protein MHU86_19711 [Fragilaria crotonensis]|nr:hypothetical protein MHU86_19711 [Fragilaria crotonensis]
MADMSSPMTMTSTWEDVFRALDQWEVVPKLNRLHTKSNSINTESTGFVHLCSPDIAHLMVNTHGTIRLFHHFHHDADDGLNDGTNALWALLGGGGFAAAMAVDTKQIVRSHVGTPYDWSKMLTWNSTSDVRRAIEELVTTRSSVSGVSERRTGIGAGAGHLLWQRREDAPRKAVPQEADPSRANILTRLTTKTRRTTRTRTTQKTSRSSVSP